MKCLLVSSLCLQMYIIDCGSDVVGPEGRMVGTGGMDEVPLMVCV